MVFTKLSAQEKDSFFGLLDEYFQSRPELFGQGGEHQGAGGIAGTGISTATAASAVQRALAVNANVTGSSASSKSNNPYLASMPTPTPAKEADIARAVAVGRVAAASLAFSGGPRSQSPSEPSQGLVPPPILPRRATSNASAPASDRAGPPGSEVDKLVTKKTSMFAFKKTENPSVSMQPIPSAFVAPKNVFGPPPVRRGTSDVPSAGGGGGGAGGVVRPAQRQAPEPEPEAQEGEWVEALYDYNSGDPGDLAIKAGTRVFVTDKTSDDWWTGQVEGEERQGLFPASYVKPL